MPSLHSERPPCRAAASQRSEQHVRAHGRPFVSDEAGQRVQIPLTIVRSRQDQIGVRLSRQKSGDARLVRLEEVMRLAQPYPKRLFRLPRIAQLRTEAIEKLERRQFASHGPHIGSSALPPASTAVKC